jgi:S-adenosylmethionine:tRNA ribosyltransferase-isomerase
MRTADFDFALPEAAIALTPATPRDAARLLVVRTSASGSGHAAPAAMADESGAGEAVFQDRLVADLPELLRPGDALVFNDTRVMRAALVGVRQRGESSTTIALNLHRRIDASRWRAFARPARRLTVGDHIHFGHDGRVCLLGSLDATVTATGEGGEVELAFSLHDAYLDQAIEALGDPPLPPYITRRRPIQPEDAERYQTVFARHEGAVAAPTAGLHFSPRLLATLAARRIAQQFVTLHVGAGTFLPVTADVPAGHRLLPEWGEVPEPTAAALNGVRRAGGRIVAVGSTVLRLLEAATAPDGSVASFRGETDIFITPGYRFRCADLLLTNFHLPRSTLFMLVAAFSGLETMRRAYAHAIAAGYRFYSYGDASLLERCSRRG